ncbi:Fc.00g034380.m01.CDS01 [Cosmosporella sp. VM-42]
MLRLDHNSETSLRNPWARQHAGRAAQVEWSKIVNSITEPTGKTPCQWFPGENVLAKPLSSPKDSAPHDHETTEHKVVKIGIVRAGVAGLFMAMVLDYLNLKLEKNHISLEFDYDILFAKLKTKQTNLKDNPNAPDSSLIPHYMQNGQNGDSQSTSKQPWCYNDITVWANDCANVQVEGKSDDPFKTFTKRDINTDILKVGPDEVMKANIKPLRDALEEDANQEPPGNSGWKQLMHYDKCSTRQFLGT